MADDAGALLVRSGLVSSSALDEARVKVDATGGTVGEQLVASGQLTDDVLTDFYKQRLLVPQVNPNILARLSAKVVAMIPSDMAIGLRAIPVALDADSNLTIAMSDPSDQHAVEQIADYTGTSIVRAVATQMQIAWCLAHYYGHVTDLGQRLLQPAPEPDEDERAQAETARAQATAAVTEDGDDDSGDDDKTPRPQRMRGITGEVNAMRHRGLVPGQVQVGGDHVNDLEIDESGHDDADHDEHDEHDGDHDEHEDDHEIDPPTSETIVEVEADEPDDEPAADPPVPIAATTRAHTISGEIRVQRRAPSVKPPLPEDSGPVVVVMEADTPPRGVAKLPPRRLRPAEPDPPELAARAGEVDLAAKPEQAVEAGPSIVIADDIEAAPAEPEVAAPAAAAPAAVEPDDDISDATPKPVSDEPSAPILLDRRRPSDQPPIRAATQKEAAVVVKGPRKMSERRTEIGVGLFATPTTPQTAAAAIIGAKRAARDTAVEDLPAALEDEVTGQHLIDNDPTRVEMRAAPPRDDTNSDELLAAPPGPAHDDDMSPLAEPPRPSPPRPIAAPMPVGVDDDGDDDEEDDGDHDDDDHDAHPREADAEPTGRVTQATIVMTAIDLDRAIPDRTSEVVPGHLAKPAKPKAEIVESSVDDGWGPPGTTIPPPLLGAVPGTDETPRGRIPLPDLEDQPLLVAPPSPPDHARPHTQTEAGVAKALEQATARVLDLIHELGQATDRDQVVATMVAHLAESHRRAGFFALRGGELSLFAITPRIAAMPAATLRLDRSASTLADVVGTRLPYRGPMHDPASRTFLQSVLGACPAEILLVPITVRERVVGVLFGEHRLRHTFDDQLALAGRAAGNALERILKARRG